MRDKARGFGPGRLALLFFLSLLMAASASIAPAVSEAADTVEVEATGTAAVGKDAAVARDAAIADALRRAVEQATGAIVSSDTVTENFQVINDSIYTRSSGYIKSYSVVSEARRAGAIEVRVRAVVATGSLAGDLAAMGLLQKKAGRPRVLFMVAEKGISEPYFGRWWEGGSAVPAADAAFRKAFLARGFNVVTGKAGKEVSAAASGQEPGVDGARSVGALFDAEVVVYGTAVVEEGPSTGSTAVVTYMAEVRVEAVRVDDGVLLASASSRSVARHISGPSGQAQAVEKAVAAVVDSLEAQISARWSGPHFVTIRLLGMDYEKAAEFKRLLRDRVRGVEAIYQRRHTGNETLLEVESREGAQSIADAVSRLGGYRVVGVSADTIEVEGAK